MKTITNIITSINAFIVVVLLAALAGPSVDAKEYHRFYRGIRPLGMGDAFSAVADDENALYYNPAGLADISALTIGIINPQVEISGKSVDLLYDINDTDTGDVGEVADLLRDYIGDHQHVRTGLYPYVGFNVADMGIMIGGIVQLNMDAEVRNPTWPEAITDAQFDKGIIGGIGGKLPLTGLRAGASLKAIHRDSLNETYTAADIADDDFENRLEDDFKSGSGIAMDFGALYTLPFIEAVTADVGAVVQNVPKMNFGDAKDMETQANIGVAVKKSFAKFSLLGALDYQDVTHTRDEDDDFPKRLHAGLEFSLPAVLSLRAGLNQGYPSFGATLSIWVIRFDFAAYTEEVGAYAGQRDDRRYAGQLSIGW